MPSGYGHWTGENSGGGGMWAAVVVVGVAGFAAVSWLARELVAIRWEIAVIGGGTVAFVVVAGIACAVKFRRGSLPGVNQAAKADAIADRRAIEAAPVRVNVTVNVSAPAPAAPQYHAHNHLHLHGGAARDLLAAVAGRRARSGEVEDRQPAAIDAPQARVIPGAVETRPLVPVKRRERA
jgi:hypothetical protein